jgi:AsmA protein
MTPGGRARRILIGLLLLVSATLATALALPRLVDVNRYRPLIEAKVREVTGRSVRLGTLGFSLLPRPSIAVGRLAISDSDRYPGRDALVVESLSIRLGLLGLLRGRVSLDSIVLSRPTLTLIRDARGRWNFDDLLARVAAAGGPGAPSGPAPSSQPAAGSPFVSIDRASIRSGRILIYDDAVVPGSRAQAILAPVDATVSGWGAGSEPRLDLIVGLGGSSLRCSGRLIAKPSPHLQGTFDGRALQATDLARLLPWLGVARGRGLEVGGALALKGSADLPLDRPEAIRFHGTVRLEDLSYRDAGMARPVNGLSGTLSVNGDRATWSDFAVRIGSSSLEGSLSVEDFLRPRVGFTLTSSRLDFNEILGTFTPAPGVPAGEPGPSASSGLPPGPQPQVSDSGGLVSQVRGSGTLSVRAIRFLTFDLSDVRAGVALTAGTLSLKDLKAAFYGGTLGGSASVEMARAIPHYTVGVTMKEVAVDPLLQAYDPSLGHLLSGAFAGNLDLASSGADMKPILAGAVGSGAISLTNGSISSFSVLKQLASLLEMVGGKGIGRDSTPFESLTAHLTVGAGRATTNDLTLRSPDLDLEGQGWVGLDATMDLAVTARFSPEASQGMLAKTPRLTALSDRNGRLAVHFTLAGGLASPSFRLDTRSQMGELKEKKKEEVKQRVLERLQDHLRKGLGDTTDGGHAAPHPTPEGEAPPQ